MALADLVLVTPPTEQAITVAEAKAYLNIEHDTDDAVIDTLVAGVLDHLEGYWGYLGRVLVTQTWAMRLPAFPFGDVLALPMAPVSAVSSVTYRDPQGATQTLASSKYVVLDGEHARIVLADGESWPSTQIHPRAVTVTFVCGYGAAEAVPAAVRQAALMIVADAYENRESGGAIRIDGPPANLLAGRRRIPT